MVIYKYMSMFHLESVPHNGMATHRQKQVPSNPKGPESNALQDPVMVDLVRALGFKIEDLRGLVAEEIDIN